MSESTTTAVAKALVAGVGAALGFVSSSFLRPAPSAPAKKADA